MGQHKNNPTAIKAKEGNLSPKKRGPGKAESERMMRKHILDIFQRSMLGRWIR